MYAVDTKQPDIVFCPENIQDTIEAGTTTKSIFWLDPVVSDLSGLVSLASQSHFSGNSFLAGKTGIKYIFQDAAGNQAVCQFNVSLTLGKW